MITVLFCIAIAAFITAVMSAIGKCPGWVPTILLCVFALIQTIPLK